jgi:hypothetical protein
MKKVIIILIILSTVWLCISTVWLCMEKINDKTMFIPKQLGGNTRLPQHSTTTLEQMIINYSIQNGINYETSLRIANCESKMGKYKVNWDGSSAYGLYQFMPKTFNYYCQGNIESDIDQIKCFVQLYNKYPHYWECK